MKNRLSSALGRAQCVLAIVGLLTTTAGAEERFLLSADGTEVADVVTGLVWQRCSAGQTAFQGTCAGTAVQLDHEQALAFATGSPGWRLPNAKELHSIVDISRFEPAIDSGVFPGTPSNAYYWSSTPAAREPSNAVTVGFDVGGVSDFHRFFGRMHVRLVR